MSTSHTDYLDSIQLSLDDLKAADAPLYILRELDAHCAAVRDFVIEHKGTGSADLNLECDKLDSIVATLREVNAALDELLSNRR
jgi:hypothetical protein